MKTNLSYYSRRTDSHRHDKFKMLRLSYNNSIEGWAAEAKFWALNDIIAESEMCLLDLQQPRNKARVAVELNFTLPELDHFLSTLVSPDVELLFQPSPGIFSTKKVLAALSIVLAGRDKARERKKKNSSKDEFSNQSSHELVESSPELLGSSHELIKSSPENISNISVSPVSLNSSPELYESSPELIKSSHGKNISSTQILADELKNNLTERVNPVQETDLTPDFSTSICSSPEPCESSPELFQSSPEQNNKVKVKEVNVKESKFLKSKINVKVKVNHFEESRYLHPPSPIIHQKSPPPPFYVFENFFTDAYDFTDLRLLKSKIPEIFSKICSLTLTTSEVSRVYNILLRAAALDMVFKARTMVEMFNDYLTLPPEKRNIPYLCSRLAGKIDDALILFREKQSAALKENERSETQFFLSNPDEDNSIRGIINSLTKEKTFSLTTDSS
ncbi:MAG: hypothetical protein M0P61_05880 [Ignavibacteriaceae bacterium]|nr:hypothetical protein [Ignavibacteriaceae bacterium]